MNQPLTAAEMDDAEYRARLAPLAKAVLPRAEEPPYTPERRSARAPIAMAAIAAAAMLLAGTWMYAPWPRAVPAPAAVPARHATAPAPAASRTTPPRTTTTQSATLQGILLNRGNAALRHGDITAARLLLQRAADAGSADAAHALGTTYDVQVLLSVGARATDADPAQAAFWYRRAAELKAPEIEKRPLQRDGNGR